jgi:AcrR family transcriptional regulator
METGNQPQTKGERTKAKILEKAADLFAEKGYTAVTMKDVCEAAGLSRGGLYRYFGSTAEMMILLMRAEQQHADSEAAREHGEHSSAVRMLDAFLAQHYSFMLSHRGRLELAMNQFAQSDETGRQENRRRVEAAVRRTADLIRFGQEEGSFRAGDSEELAFHVIMAIGGLRTMAPLMDIGKSILRRQLSAIRGLVLTDAAMKETQREEE